MRIPISPAAIVVGAVLACFAAPDAARAQAVVNPVDHLDFDRPESWALKYFTSPTLMTGLEMPGAIRPGATRIGVELAWIPSLTSAQQRIGFNGTKQEDLNKAPMFARPRVTVGLPGNLSLTLAGVPPVKTFGITPHLFAVGLGRPLLAGQDWFLGVRGSAQLGTAKSDFTCPPSVLAYEPGDSRNSYGCQAQSSDVATLRFVTGEVDVWHPLAAVRGLTPHATLGLTYMNSTFQVDALTFDFHDRTKLLTSGVTASVSGGVGYALTDRIQASFDLFYTPLGVQRPPASSSSIEGLFNVRGFIGYRVH